MGLISGVKDYQYASRLLENQQDFTEKIYLNKHQWVQKDLQAAGLNRILALGAQQAGSPGINAPSSGGVDYAARAMEAGKYTATKKHAASTATTAKSIAGFSAATAKSMSEKAFQDALTAGFNSDAAQTNALREGMRWKVDQQQYKAHETVGAFDRTALGQKMIKIRRGPVPLLVDSSSRDSCLLL